MKILQTIAFILLLLTASLSFSSDSVVSTSNRESCQITLGIDMSSSVPWNTAQDELSFAVEQLVAAMDGSVQRGDTIVIKPFGSFHDRTTTNKALETHNVRRDQINRKTLEQKVYSVIQSTPASQEETSILGFLHNLPRLSRKISTCAVYLLTDGYESSEFGKASEFATGKPLPVRRQGYLKGVELVFVGFGVTLDSHSSATSTGLEDAWFKHCEEAGAVCDIVNW